ncbi:MAG: tRNA uridine-5-carboxymethylaminomethyl(34) synthesis enzyme MnmG [Bacteroidetes bacterium]|nr:tRNA uridine-5-carboxymethylaminomethyl(34) synthesis enzyme MnmG [Bacteroidota bacterium]
MKQEYDVIVVGAGHAGCEAAAAAANMGSKVLLITMDMTKIAQMSCNPAMGGIAKGQIVREIDALGGYSGIVSDRTTIQFRMLNRSKGPAMWSPRSQNDRTMFTNEWRKMLEQTPNVDFWQDMVRELIISPLSFGEGLGVRQGEVTGVITGMGMEFSAKSVILTNGTFLNGIIHIGEKQFGGGRVGEASSEGITEQLVSLGFQSGRMKTGTPPRVDGRTLDYSKMELQPGDEQPSKFSYLDGTSPFHQAPPQPSLMGREQTRQVLPNGKDLGWAGKVQIPCYLTHTNAEVHDILKTGFDKSPMYAGRIQGLGPRYCPSIEDKITRFADKERHLIFVEPEGWDTVEIYVNGFSTSLPEDVQMKALRKMSGFENCKMFRPGYAIEYDYFPPTQLNLTLETNRIQNLYFAGQINGTTGYEEAACQGLMAGINAHLKINHKEPFILTRSEAYIGVLIDDLVTKGTDEPYRMFTSRAEYRILLRQDNADVRLTPKSYEMGLASKERYERVKQKNSEAGKIMKFFKDESISPEEINPFLESIGSAPISQKVRMFGVLARPGVSLNDFVRHSSLVKNLAENFHPESLEQAEILMKYEGYISKEYEMAEKIQRLEEIKLHEDFDYHRLTSLSSEAREKLSKIRPNTIGQASRISGVNPSDVSILLVYLGR